MSELPAALADLPATPRMPAVFVGHGNPMFAIEDSEYGRAWRALGESLPAPRAILVVSAHWMTRGATMVHVGAKPKTIHDFAGFPRELFRQQYPAPGAPDVAQATIDAGQAQPSRARRAMGPRSRRLVGAAAHVPQGRRAGVPAFARPRQVAGRAFRARQGAQGAARARRAGHRLRQPRPQSDGDERRARRPTTGRSISMRG